MMKIFTKTTRVLGVSRSELDALMKLVADARTRDKAEIQIGQSQYFAVEVDDKYAYHEAVKS